MDKKKFTFLLLPIFLFANHFVGVFMLATYGEQKYMVAKGAGRRPCPLFGIRGSASRGFIYYFYGSFNPFPEHGRCSEVGRFSGVRYGGLHCMVESTVLTTC